MSMQLRFMAADRFNKVHGVNTTKSTTIKTVTYKHHNIHFGERRKYRHIGSVKNIWLKALKNYLNCKKHVETTLCPKKNYRNIMSCSIIETMFETALPQSRFVKIQRFYSSSSHRCSHKFKV